MDDCDKYVIYSLSFLFLFSSFFAEVVEGASLLRSLVGGEGEG